MMTRWLGPRGSLRRRLPLLISAFIAVVLATFLWVAYQGVRRTLVETAGGRALEIANQVGSLLVQSSQQRRAEMLRVAADPAVQSYLEHPGRDPEAARARLATLAINGASQSIELWNAAGTRVLSLIIPPEAAGTMPAGLPPSPSDQKPLRVYGNAMFSEFFVPVQSEPSSAAVAPAARTAGGFLLVRRPLAVGNSDALNRLIGSGAVVEVGNKADNVWTDLASPVPPPAVDLTRPGVAQYRVAKGGRRIGALADVRGTPWAVWLDFPESTVLAPARLYLERMAFVALAFIAIAAVLTGIMSARITAPLHELTEASEAIAAGEYSRRVASGRPDEVGRLGAAFNAMTGQVAAMHRELEHRVQQRTASLSEARAALERSTAELQERMMELAVVNQELEAFSYSVSHDLRAPLRHVAGFASLLEQRASGVLDEQGRRHVKTIIDAAARMGRLIDDLLTFSRVGRAALTTRRVDLGELVHDVRREVSADAGDRQIVWTVHPLPCVEADAAMLRLVLGNLLSNAVKYSSTRPVAEIEIGSEQRTPNEAVIFVRDNGVGFDPQYTHKLFGVFQRLHAADEFEGTGIGLANVKRIVHRHGGRAWAEGIVNGGATFFFSLPIERNQA